MKHRKNKDKKINSNDSKYSEFELSLQAQREILSRSKDESKVEKNNEPAVLPGYDYDHITKRYFKSNSLLQQNKKIEKIELKEQKSCIKNDTNFVIPFLNREIKRATNFQNILSSNLYVEKIETKLKEVCNDIYFDKNYGLIRSFRSCIIFGNNHSNEKVVDLRRHNILPNHHNIQCLSWYPKQIYNDSGMIAALSGNGSKDSLLLLKYSKELNNALSPNINLLKYIPCNRISSDKARCMCWNNNDDNLLIGCDSGVYTINLENTLTNFVHPYNSKLKPKIIETHISPIVTMINPIPSILMKGHRNGNISITDFRMNSTAHESNCMKYCMDTIYLLSDEKSLIAQDISNNIKLYDIRYDKHSYDLFNMNSSVSSKNNVTMNTIHKKRFGITYNEKQIIVYSSECSGLVIFTINNPIEYNRVVNMNCQNILLTSAKYDIGWEGMFGVATYPNNTSECHIIQGHYR